MEYSKGEVIISPKIIYWVQPPVSLGENDRIELLKRDVLLINFDSNIKDLVQLKEKDNPYSGYSPGTWRWYPRSYKQGL